MFYIVCALSLLSSSVAWSREAIVTVPLSTYHYLSATNISNTPQTVTLRFSSATVPLKAGGFHRDITGWTSPTGPTASTGVTCTPGGCSITRTLAARGASVRMGVRIDKGLTQDYTAGGPAFSTATQLGLEAKVSIAETSGRVIAMALIWSDFDYSPTQFVDSGTTIMINNGKPF